MILPTLSLPGLPRVHWVAGLPLRGQMVPILGAFVCIQGLYGRIAGLPWFGLDLAPGLLTFMLLFIQLRLVDDLDDLARDRPDPADQARHRRRLVGSLLAILGLIVALNLSRPTALGLALAATLLTYAAPFGFKRFFPGRLAVGFLVFEGAPALCFAYGYGFWRDTAGPSLGPLQILPVVVLFWAGYEFWKFSRKVHSTAFQPYFLTHRAVLRVLRILLLPVAASATVLAVEADLSRVFTAFALGLAPLLLAWMHREPPRPGGSSPAWAGLTLVGLLEAALVLELVFNP